MKYKKIMIILITAIFLASIAGVCAADANDTTVASKDTNQMDLSSNDETTEDNLKTSEENTTLTQANDAESDSQILSEGEGTYYDLIEEIGSGGDKNLAKSYYRYTGGDTIEITTSGVINGNGAVIDMTGSNIRAFTVSASGVTIKNLTIKNANYNGDGGAIYFSSSGTVSNCNFTNNTASNRGGAIYFSISGSTHSVENCNFTNNTASNYYGGAVCFNSNGEVTNCNFTGNTATMYGGAVCFNSNGNVTNCNFVDNKATGDYSYGGAIDFEGSGTVTNCNFTDNSATANGGAVCFNSNGNVTNCNFVDNKATGGFSCGGAIDFEGSGTVTNCNFTDNSATVNGGAVFFHSTGNVTNCNFTRNTAFRDGGAIDFEGSGTVTNCNFTDNSATANGGAVFFHSTGNVTNCNFADNSACNGGAIFSMERYTTADTCIFKRNSGDNVNTFIYPPTLNVNNFTTVYGSGDKLTFDLKTNSSIPVTNGNISISVYFKDNGVWVRNYTCLSGEGWIPDLPVGSYIAFFDTEYAEFQRINRTVTITMPNVRYSINVSSLATNNKTVNITAKSDIPKDILWEGKLLFILANSTQINANYADNGTWWAVHRFDDYGVYQVSASYIGLDNVTINNATITVSKVNTVLTADAVTATYNINRYFVITLKDANGNALSGAKLTVDLNGAREYVTDANGQVKVNVVKLVPKTYTAIITFNGDDIYAKSTRNVQVIVKKAKAKIVAKKKTFKKAKKVKKYTVTLKDNNGKAMKKVKLTLKVKGKTYKAKTNAKGKAVFKIKNLKKKGKYNAVITFKGDKYYNKVTKKVKIKIK